MKRSLVEILPKPLKASLRWLLRFPVKMKTLFNRMFSKKLTMNVIKQKLIALGVRSGGVCFVHSSLSSLGFVEGGAEAVIVAMLDIIGQDGTLVMPAFGWTPRGETDYLDESNPVFDVNSSPSKLGKITEVFRKWPGVLRSCHPTHSVVALGKNAEFLTRDHHLSTTPFDKHSPYYKLLELNADVLCLGVSVQYITFYHVFEDLTLNFPINVYHDKAIKVLVYDAIHAKKIVSLKYHRQDVAARRLEQNPQVLNRVIKRFKENGILKEIPIGQGKAFLLNTRDIIKTLSKMLEKGETIYAAE